MVPVNAGARDVNRYDLEAVTVPVLIVHAADDPAASYDAARQAAGRIPRTRLIQVDRGAHLMFGPQQAAESEIAPFLRKEAQLRPDVVSAPGPAGV